MSSALERARQNIKLENLNKILADISVRDELTGLYNRMGYEKIAIPYLDELRHTKQNCVIMVADINRMKVINDKYGHLQGDTAIKIVASVIKSSIPKNWKAVRYGGDEYVIIGDYILGIAADRKSLVIQDSRTRQFLESDSNHEIPQLNLDRDEMIYSISYVESSNTLYIVTIVSEGSDIECHVYHCKYKDGKVIGNQPVRMNG